MAGLYTCNMNYQSISFFLLLSPCYCHDSSLIGWQSLASSTTIHDYLLWIICSIIVIIGPCLVATPTVIALDCSSHYSFSVLIVWILLSYYISSILRIIHWRNSVLFFLRSVSVSHWVLTTKFLSLILKTIRPILKAHVCRGMLGDRTPNLGHWLRQDGFTFYNLGRLGWLLVIRVTLCL